MWKSQFRNQDCPWQTGIELVTLLTTPPPLSCAARKVSLTKIPALTGRELSVLVYISHFQRRK